jgi:hypothetical protein
VKNVEWHAPRQQSWIHAYAGPSGTARASLCGATYAVIAAEYDFGGFVGQPYCAECRAKVRVLKAEMASRQGRLPV